MNRSKLRMDCLGHRGMDCYEATQSIDSERESKSDKLWGIERLIQEIRKEVDTKEKLLSEVERKITARTEKLSWVELKLEAMEGVLDKFNADVDIKGKQLSRIRGSIEERKKEFYSLEKCMEWWTGRLGLKESDLNGWVKKVESLENKVLSRLEELSLLDKKVTECFNEVQSREKELDSLGKAIEERHSDMDLRGQLLQEWSLELEMRESQFEEQAKDLELKQKQIDLRVEERQKQLNSQKMSLQDSSTRLEMREKKLESQVTQLELKQEEFDLRIKECKSDMDVREKSLQQESHELQMRERRLQDLKSDMGLQEESLQQRSRELEIKERQLDEKAKDLELLKRELQECKSNMDLRENSLQQGSRKLEMRERQLKEKAKDLEKQVQNLKSKEEFSTTGRGLQLLLNEHLKKIDFVGSKIAAALQVSSDPAQLVLDAMDGFYPNSAMNNGECGFDLVVIRRSCILLLQQLKKFSPQINPEVKGKAIKLAADWKAMMTVGTDNWMEILGFLWLVSTYEFTTAYDPKELQNLLGIVAQQEQAKELCEAFDFIHKAPESNNVFVGVKIEEPESSAARYAATSSTSPTVQPKVISDTRNFQGSSNLQSCGNQAMHNELVAAKQVSLINGPLALKLIEMSLKKCWGKGGFGVEAAVMEHNIALLNNLPEVLPNHGPNAKDVKENAAKLAVQWKRKMRANGRNSLEVMCFLHFIATYGLLSIFSKDEIVKLLEKILRRPEGVDLCCKHGFANKIPDFIQNLVERKKFCEVIELIVLFKLIGKFPPALLLKGFTEDAKKAVEDIKKSCRGNKTLDRKDVENTLARLRRVDACIKHFHLESEFPSKYLATEIKELENIMKNWENKRKLSFTIHSTSKRVKQLSEWEELQDLE